MNDTLVKQARGPDKNSIGTRTNNMYTGTFLYKVRMPKSSTRDLTYNKVAENIFATTNSEGRQYQLIDEILDNRANKTAIQKDDGWV